MVRFVRNHLWLLSRLVAFARQIASREGLQPLDDYDLPTEEKSKVRGVREGSAVDKSEHVPEDKLEHRASHHDSERHPDPSSKLLGQDRQHGG